MSNDGANFSQGGSRPLFGSDLLSGIVASAADIALTVDGEGMITAAMAGMDSRAFAEAAKWPGASLRELLTPEAFEKFQIRQADVVKAAGKGDKGAFRWAELLHRAENAADFPVRYSLHWLEDRAQLLMLGRDQRPLIEIQQQLIGAQVALERDFEAQRKLDTRYRLLMDSTRDPFMLIAMQGGTISDLNSHAASVIGHARSDCIGQSLASLLDGGAAADLLGAISSGSAGDMPRAIGVTFRESQRSASLHAKLFRAGGERLALCRIEETGQGQSSGNRLTGWLSDLFYRGSDAIVFTDREGVIDTASEAFLNLIDAEGVPAVRGRSLADFLTRGTVDLKILLENARRAGHVRAYATRLTTDFNAQLSVEVAATWLNDRAEPVLALVIRDTSLALRMRSDGGMGEDGARGVMELVGSAPLKDIVAETANEVEKICIETAIELTRNNRVAAAEMLGVSRQSLYVKLRKYGMLGRDED